MFNVKFKGHEDGIYNVSSVTTVEQANKIKLDLLGLGYTVWVEEAKPAPTHQEMYGAISQCLEQEMDCLMHKCNSCSKIKLKTSMVYIDSKLFCCRCVINKTMLRV